MPGLEANRPGGADPLISGVFLREAKGTAWPYYDGMAPNPSCPDPVSRRGGPTGPDQPGALPARLAALRILSDLRESRRTVRESIDVLIHRDELAGRELGLTTELVMGVVRHRLTLARILDCLADRGWKRIDRQLRDVLMLGAYQLIWLDGIPEFAAVNESVEQAKAAGGPRGGRFANALLRQLLREIEQRRIPNEHADAVRAVPIDERHCCQFRRPMLPDPATKPVEHLAVVTSHPVWLVSRWASVLGIEETTRICRAGMSRPPIFLRPNPLRTAPADLLARLLEEGYQAQLSSTGDAIVVAHAAALTRSAAFVQGWFQPQDRTAMEVVRQMSLSPGQQVIDLCAGAGTKATQIAEIMHNRGTVLACDKDEGKLERVRANCERLGYTIVRTVSLSEIEAAAASLGKVDWILIDAPCSNTGVLARRPEARYRINRRLLGTLSGLQRQLLARAARLAGERTRLLYSTCSIDPAENEDVTSRFARTHPQWRLSASRRTLPAAGEPAAADWHDGGYWAIWVRRRSLPNPCRRRLTCLSARPIQTR